MKKPTTSSAGENEKPVRLSHSTGGSADVLDPPARAGMCTAHDPAVPPLDVHPVDMFACVS